MTNLSQYKNILEWAIHAHSEDVTITEKKLDMLRQCNDALGKNYKVTHLDNWLAGRKPTPRDIMDYWRDALLEAELEFDTDEYGAEIRRLLALRQ